MFFVDVFLSQTRQFLSFSFISDRLDSFFISSRLDISEASYSEKEETEGFYHFQQWWRVRSVEYYVTWSDMTLHMIRVTLHRMHQVI